MKKEKAVVAALTKRNKTSKDSIAQLEAKKKELETKLMQVAPTREAPPEEEVKETPGYVEAESEEAETSGVTVAAIDGEAIVENQGAVSESTAKRVKKPTQLRGPRVISWQV